MLIALCAPAFAAAPDAPVRLYLQEHGVNISGDFELLFNSGHGESPILNDTNTDTTIYDGDSEIALVSETHQNERLILQLDLIGQIQFRPKSEDYMARLRQAIADTQPYIEFTFSEQSEDNPCIYPYIPLLQAPIEKEVTLNSGRYSFTFNDFDLSDEMKALLSTSATENGPTSPLYDNTPIGNYVVRLAVLDAATGALLSTFLINKLDFYATEAKDAMAAEINSITISHIDGDGNVTRLSQDIGAPSNLPSLAGSFVVESSLRSTVRTASIAFIPIIDGTWDYGNSAQIYLDVYNGNASGRSGEFRTGDGNLMSYDQLKGQEEIINAADGLLRVSFDCFIVDDYGNTIRVDKPFYIDMTASSEQPARPPADTALFSDLSVDHWAFSEISSLVEKGVITGYPGGYFAPNNNITRSEFAKLMVVALDLPLMPPAVAPEGWAPGYPSSTRQDALYLLDKTTWYYIYAVSAAEYLEFKEKTNDSGVFYDFDADVPASRIDITAALVRVLGLQDEISDADISVFSDYSDIPASQRNYAALAYQYGIISGYPDGTFRPLNPITRAEACYILVNILNSRLV